MSGSAAAGNPLLKATTIGTVLQVLMVVGGHFMPQLAQLFPVLGTGLGGLTGLLFGLFSKGAAGGALAGGAAPLRVASAACSGSAVSMAMGDVTGRHGRHRDRLDRRGRRHRRIPRQDSSAARPPDVHVQLTIGRGDAVPKYLTEFIGTFFLTLTACLTVTGDRPIPALAIGCSLMIMVYMGGHISGASLQPGRVARRSCSGRSSPRPTSCRT